MRHLPKVLIVEDESSIAELISVNLRHNGMTPIWAEDGESAQREIDAVLPDVILLDWMLPGQSGVTWARKWRNDPRTKSVPILMLTGIIKGLKNLQCFNDLIPQRSISLHYRQLTV